MRLWVCSPLPPGLSKDPSERWLTSGCVVQTRHFFVHLSLFEPPVGSVVSFKPSSQLTDMCWLLSFFSPKLLTFVFIP